MTKAIPDFSMEVEQHTGIEPASSAWKADMLPLHQCCKEVGMDIFRITKAPSVHTTQ